jgi:TetR/AcrR family transcriptional regulator, cholesterol catabolism regulator
MEPHLNISDAQEQLGKILQKASEQFLTIGIRSVTLDDIARELGISKKTIYAHFENKGELVYQCVQEDISRKQKTVEAIISEDNSALEHMLFIGKQVIQDLSTFSVNIALDLMKFYPESWQLVDQHKKDFVSKVIINNIIKGKQEGLYRENINEESTAWLYIAFMDSIMTPQAPNKNGLSASELYREHLLHHMYSICTEKGRETLEELLTTIRLSHS